MTKWGAMGMIKNEEKEGKREESIQTEPSAYYIYCLDDGYAARLMMLNLVVQHCLTKASTEE